jgi:hypothetical protein
LDKRLRILWWRASTVKILPTVVTSTGSTNEVNASANTDVLDYSCGSNLRVDVCESRRKIKCAVRDDLATQRMDGGLERQNFI